MLKKYGTDAEPFSGDAHYYETDEADREADACGDTIRAKLKELEEEA